MKWVVTVTAIFLVLLAACAPAGTTLQAKPLNASAPADASCAGVTCTGNTHCEAGECVCDGGLKKCGNACISQTACCANADCPADRTCKNGACVQRPTCGYGEQWQGSEQECACDEGFKFCAEQGKCIPADHCCWHNSCDDDQRCPPTTYGGTVCLKGATKKCRILHESRTLTYAFAQGEYDITLANILEGPKFELKVNNDTVRRIAIGELNTVDTNLQLFVEDFQLYGGRCKEDVD